MNPTGGLLFTPGDGAVPPVLSGREEQQALLSRCLANLVDGRSPPHNVVLLGPRGNGKTALLNWFRRECVASGAVDAVALAPHDIPDSHTLAATLRRRSRWLSWRPRKVAVAGVGSAEWEPRLGAPSQLSRRLIARCAAKPLAVLLDEAHTLDVAVGGALLNASQQVRAEAPFLLVLAGTPGLPAHLAKMDASFWNRLGPGRLGVGRLSEDAAGAALREPLEDRGGRVVEAALATVVEESQCYPYFVQLWGEAVWQQRSSSGGVDLTAETVDAARPVVAASVTDYYQDRYRELETAGLLAAAAAVAPVFQADADAGATDGDIDDALASTGADDAARLVAREALHRLGYIWCPPGQAVPVVWHAGIPSLMSHVQRRFAAKRQR